MNVNQLPERILMTADTLGGVWTYACELCSVLNEFDIQVGLATMGRPLSDSQRKDISELSNITLFESSYKLEWMQDPWYEIDQSIKWLQEIKEDFKPDIIHLNTFAHAVPDWDVPVVTVAHSDVLSWWECIKGEAPPEQWQEYYYRVNAGLVNSDMVIAPSHFMMNMLTEHYGPLGYTRVISNGRNKSLFKIARKENYIFSAGRLWDEAKNIQLLIQASSNINWNICIAGEEQHPGNAGKHLDINKLNFLGKLSCAEIAQKLSAASIYVLPAKYEPFGLSALEAALSGCALVLGNIGSLREIWEDSALFVDTDNNKELAAKINTLINDPPLLKQYRGKAYRTAQKYSHRIMGIKYLEVYRDLNSIKQSQRHYENTNVLPLASFRLEPWERALSKRNSYRTNLQGGNSSGL